MTLGIPDDELPMQQREAAQETVPKMLAHERINAKAIAAAILCWEGEFVIVRSAFRWLKHGTDVIPNAYEMFDMEQVCEERDWRIVERYGDHIAIVAAQNHHSPNPLSQPSEIRPK